MDHCDAQMDTRLRRNDGLVLKLIFLGGPLIKSGTSRLWQNRPVQGGNPLHDLPCDTSASASFLRG